MIETSAALPDRPACLPLVRDTIHREEPVSHWSTDNDASVTDGACTRATQPSVCPVGHLCWNVFNC